MRATLLDTIETVYPKVVNIRRHIHANPELSGREFATAALIHRELSALGLKPRFWLKKTGVTATIKNGPGKTIVLRADTDALPVEEKNQVPFRSRVPGVMHACGHDMHTAGLIGGVDVLLRMKEHWQGTLVALFQPSEEVEPGGAVQLIKAGAFPRQADAVFGLHVTADHYSGQVGVKSGDDYSGVLVFDVVVKGKGGHGAQPERAVDPIVCASSMILELQTLISREVPPFEPAVVTVGSLHAGTKRNVIPDEARFEGTIRTFADSVQRQLKKRVTAVLKATARSFRASVDVRFEHSYPAGYNDPQHASRAGRALAGVLGPKMVITREHPTMASEDFACYQRIVPGVYVHLGVGRRGVKEPWGIHSARFLPEESALRTAMAVHATLAMDCFGTTIA